MTEEEFSKLPLFDKWMHIATVMDYIHQMDNMYEVRRRLNPHHPERDKKQEERNLRMDQYQRWSHIKNLYAAHRDELANTLDIPKYCECKNVLEKVFTLEVDDALKDILE